MTVTHQFVSTVPDDSDPDTISPSDWNADHVSAPPVVYNDRVADTPGSDLTDYAPSGLATAFHLSLNPSADIALNSIVAQGSGRLLWVENTSASFTVTVKDNAGATANNRIRTPGGDDLLLGESEGILIQYVGAASRWRVVSVGVNSGLALARHTDSATDAHDASAVSVDSTTLIGTAVTVQGALEELDDAIAAGGAPANADYLVGTSNGTLSSEIVVGATPGGELGGSWASPTVDATHSGSTHSAATDTHIADTSAAHAASAVSADSTTLVGTGTDVQAVLEELDDAIVALKSPDYLVGIGTATLSGEIVVGTTPGGELGGTWGSPTVDASHSGSTHAATQAAAEATAASALSTHAGAADPHTGYLKESNTIDFLVGTATAELAGEIVVGATPGGELGGTWDAPTVDATHSGSAHHSAITIGADTEHTLSGQVLSGADGTTTQKGHLTIGATAPPAVSTAGAAGAASTEAASQLHVHAHEAAHINHDTTWAAKGDLIAGTANDTAAVVTVGADDTILMADSAQSTGLKWVASATPVAVGTANATGTSDDFARATHVHAHEAQHIDHDTLWAAKGDIAAGTANDTAAVLTAGTNGQMLTAQSGQTTGLQWATVFTQANFSKSGTLTTSTGALKWYNRTGRTLTFDSVSLAVGTAPTGAAILVDVNVDGTTIYSTQGNRPTIAISGTSSDNTTAPDTTTIADNHYITVDVDQVGSTVAGADMVVTVWMTG